MNKNDYKVVFNNYARPMIIRSVFNSLMHTADRLIAAMFIGAQALVATTLTSPLMYMTYAIAALFIGGLGAYVGLLMGREKYDKANRAASGVMVILAIVGIILTLAVFLFREQVVHFLGARGALIPMTQDYLRIYALSFPFILVGKGLDVLIYNDDSPRYSFIVNVITTAMNLTLNIWTVAVLDMGIIGLAGASLVSAMFQTLSGIYYFAFKAQRIHLRWPSIEIAMIRRIIYNGLSDFAMLIVDGVMVYVVNQAFSRFLTPSHFEGYAAANILMILFYGIFMGATTGLQPIFSRAMGQGRFAYLLGLLRFSINKTMIFGLVAYLSFLPVAHYALQFFVEDPKSLEYAYFFYWTIGFAVLFSNLPLQSSLFFTAINRPVESAIISILRTLIFIPIFSYAGIMLVGPLGLAVGFLTADVILIMGLVVYMRQVDLGKMRVND